MLTIKTQEQLEALKSTLQAVETCLKAVLSVSAKDIGSQLEPLQQASVHLALAQSVSVVYQTFLRLHGSNLDSNPFAKDIERLRLYSKKVEKVEAEKWLKEHKPALSLSIAAANRFITNAIPDLSAEQKAALRKAGRAQKEQQRAQAPLATPVLRMVAREEAEAFLDTLQAGGAKSGAATPNDAKKRTSSEDLGSLPKKSKKLRRAEAKKERLLQQHT